MSRRDKSPLNIHKPKGHKMSNETPESSANNLGRGHTSSINPVDEAPFIKTEDVVAKADTDSKTPELIATDADIKEDEVPVEHDASKIDPPADIELVVEPIVADISADLAPIAPSLDDAPVDYNQALAQNVPDFVTRQRGYLMDYKRVMDRTNRASEAECGIQQRRLLTVFYMLFNLKGRNFLIALDDLLSFIHTHSDYMFSDKYSFRALNKEVFNVGDTERIAFQRVLTLFKNIADPAERGNIQNRLDVDNVFFNIANGEELAALVKEYLTSHIPAN